MKHQYALGLLLALSSLSPLSAIRAAEPPKVFFSEIAWAGSARSTADEWIEIRNTGTEAVDISSWSLTGVGTSGSVLTIPSATSLSAGSAYILANYSMTDPKTTLIVKPDLVNTAVSIPNTSLNISLTDTAGTMIDSLVDPGIPNAGSSTTFSTMKRDFSSMLWFTEAASTYVSHEVIAVPIESMAPSAPSMETTVTIADPVVAEPIIVTSTPEAVETQMNPVILDSTVYDQTVSDSVGIEPIAIEMIVADAVMVEPGVPDPTIASDTVPIIIDPIVTDPVGVDPIILPEPEPVISEPIVPAVIEVPVVAEAPVVADIPVVPNEPTVIPDAAVTVASVVAVEESTPVVAAPPTTPKIIEPAPEAPAISTSTAKIGDVIISEILPSPSTGNDEWVELKNTTTAPLLLDGLTLIDASGKITNLSGSINAGGYVFIPNPSGKLNNDGDSITLMNAGLILDSMSYGNETTPAPKKDAALALVNGVWTTSVTKTLTPTISPTLYAHTTTFVPAQQTTGTTHSNESTRSSSASPALKSHVVAAVQSVATADPAPTSVSVKTASTTKTNSKASVATKTTKSAASTKKKTSTSAKSSARSVTIDDIATLADGTKVKLEGIVVAAAGLVGKRSFFLDGLEVYQSTGALADVKIGDRVSITGEVSVLSDHQRVNIQEGAARVIDQSTPIVHDYATTLPYGSLTRITGTVSARDGNAVLLNTDLGIIKLAPGNGVTITWADLAGATITATGILKHGDQEMLVLRSNDDVVNRQNNEAVSAATVAGTTTSQSSLPWTAGLLLAASSAGFGAWVWYTRPKARTPKLILHPTNV